MSNGAFQPTAYPAGEPIYIFLDTETTGLTANDGIWQLAWIAEDAWGVEIDRADVLVRHFSRPSAWVLRDTDYAKRLSADAALMVPLPDVIQSIMHCIIGHVTGDPEKVKREVRSGFYADAYLVGANPSFDDRFIRKIVPNPPWSHRLIDIEAVFMGKLGLAKPPSLRDISKIIGVENARPHDAMADSQLVRDAWTWLRRRDPKRTCSS